MRYLFGLWLIVLGLPVLAQTPGTYTLKQCIEIALANNLTLKQSENTVEGNKLLVDQVVMNRYPNLNFGVSQSTNFGRSVNPYDNTVVADQQVNSNNLSLSSSVTLFNGFQNQNTIRQRRLNLSASQEDVNTTKNNVLLGVVEAYANVLSNKALLATANSQLASTQSQIERTTRLVEAGRLPTANLLDLKSQAATEETNVVLAQNNLDLARLSLTQWMQVESSTVQDVTEPTMVVEESEEVPASRIYAMAEASQPQIKAAVARVRGAESGIALARAGYYPSLTLQAGLFTNYSSLAQNFVPGKTLETPIYQPITTFQITDVNGAEIPIKVNQVITTGPGTFQDLTFQDQFDNNLRKGFTFNLNIPIFNGFQSRIAMQNARVNERAAKIQLDQQKNQLRQTIETAATNEKAARKRLEAVEKQIAALEESYRSSEQRFNLGVLNSVDFILAKTNLTRAQNDKSRFKYDFFIRRALLDFYMGKELNFN